MKMEKPYTVGDNLDAYILFCDFIEPKKLDQVKKGKFLIQVHFLLTLIKRVVTKNNN